MAADKGTRAGGDGGDGPTAIAVSEYDTAAAVDFEGDESNLEDTFEPAAGDDRPAAVQSEPAAAAAAAAAAALAATQPEASPSSPRLERWPGFPSPSKAFARAAPMENPKGLLPPSPDVLRFIHQVM